MNPMNTSTNGQSSTPLTKGNKVYLLARFPLEVLDTLEDFEIGNESDRILDVLMEDQCWYFEIFHGDEGCCECPDAYLMRAANWRNEICSGLS